MSTCSVKISLRLFDWIGIYGDVYSPMKADSTVKQTTDRRQTDLTTNEKRQPVENHYKQAVVRGTTNPAPCCHLASANEMSNSTGSNHGQKLLPPSECKRDVQFHWQ